MARKVKYANVQSAHPDIPLPSSEVVEIGTAFTAAVPQSAVGWTFEGWYTDTKYTKKWVDGTVVSGDLALYGKWSQSETGGQIIFGYSSNSEDFTAALPNNIFWATGTKVYPKDLPALPTPTVSTTTITGWYLDSAATTLIDENGATVSSEGLNLYAKSESSLVQSVSFAYALGYVDPDSDENFPMPLSAMCAWDADALGNDSVLPARIAGEIGETVPLPMYVENLYPGTDVEAEFKGFYPAELVKSGEQPITEVTLTGDTTVYALFVPKAEPEYVDVTYKLARSYVAGVDDSGAPDPTYEEFTDEATVSLMPALSVKYLGTGAANATQYEWHDKVLKGSVYRLALPQNTTDRIDDYSFAGYYSDIDAAYPLDEIIPDIQENMTVYLKFERKPEDVLPAEDLTETYNISFEVDGYALSTDVPDGSLMPPDLKLPGADKYQPMEVDKEVFPDIIDTYIPPEPQACEGFEFEGYYYYDEEGEKVDFVPGETELTSDLVLHPEFSILDDLETETTVVLVEMTPDTLAAPAELKIDDVPKLPFAGITNPQVVKIGSTFDVSTIELPGLGETFEVEGYYRLVVSNGTFEYERFTKGTVGSSLTLFVRFKSKLADPLAVLYEIEESGDEAELIAPDYDYELAAASDVASGGFGYEPRPADLVARSEGSEASTLAVTGYYTDSKFKTPFEPEKATAAGDTITIYVKIEAKTDIMVTVDYVPKVYNLSSSQFAFEIPCAPELPLNDGNSTTFILTSSISGSEILSAVGDPAIQQFWEPNNHEYGNCYWYTKASDEAQIPEPFNPSGFTLTEPITLYPQFKADMDYPAKLGVVRRDDIKLNLTEARFQLGAASASSD